MEVKKIFKYLENKKILYYNLYFNCGQQLEELEKQGKNTVILSTGLKFSIEQVKYLKERYLILYEEYKELIAALKEGGGLNE